MVEIKSNVFVGSQWDYENQVKNQSGWFVVQACKEPYHREAIGYTTKSLDKNHPEYLMAYRPNRIILNLVDAPKPEFFSISIFKTVIALIDKKLKENYKILIHCNLGQSRGPSIGFIYLASKGLFNNKTIDEAFKEYQNIYPNYFPGQGIKLFIKKNWEDLSNNAGEKM